MVAEVYLSEPLAISLASTYEGWPAVIVTEVCQWMVMVVVVERSWLLMGENKVD